MSQAAAHDEIDAVEQRYQLARADVAGRGGDAAAQAFETKVAAAQAVIGRPIEEALRFAKSDHEGYATYYQLVHAGVRIPHGDPWDRLRGLADEELFGRSKDKIRFAALSIDGAWLRNYGTVAFVLKESMIAHRATVFEENSAVFFQRQREQGVEPPKIAGHRARWCDRGKLALAKHAKDLTAPWDDAGLPTILLRSGAGSGDDVFIEVHIYGSMTRHCLERMLVDGANVSPAFVTDLRDRLAKISIDVEER